MTHVGGFNAGDAEKRMEAVLRLYRILTGDDDAAFCKRVSEALNKGWHLYGSPTLTFDSVQARVICGQALVKDAAGEWTEDMKREDFKLSEQ